VEGNQGPAPKQSRTQTCVLLLCGGDKRKQSSDIAKAIEYLKDYKKQSASP
jgi:putative component of toxin-antitoxin plasmid stabilization module